MPNDNGGTKKNSMELYAMNVNRVTVKLLKVITDECQNDLSDMSGDQQRVIACHAIFNTIKGVSLPVWLLSSNEKKILLEEYDMYAEKYGDVFLDMSDDLHKWKQ